MSKPTPAQRAILEKLASGERIRTGYYGRRFMGMDTVMPKTFDALLRGGWIEPLGEPTSNIRRGTGDRDHVITAAGRAALAAQRVPGAECGPRVSEVATDSHQSETGGCL